MIHSDFNPLQFGDLEYERREEENLPYDWISHTLLSFMIMCICGAIAFGLFYNWPAIAALFN